MRERKEIEKDAEPREISSSGISMIIGGAKNEHILEVLLDIRELLTPHSTQ